MSEASNLLERLSREIDRRDQAIRERDVAIGNMDHMLMDVTLFHQKFNLPVTEDGPPRMLPPELQVFREKFLDEELQEYKDACAAGDMPKAFDALMDLAWVAIGTALYHRFPWSPGWREVKRANMDKVPNDGTFVKERNKHLPPGSVGTDIMKPEGWIGPKIEEVLRDHVYVYHRTDAGE